MSGDAPKQIICAVRGGPESRATVSNAISMALNSGARLTFLHVMDAEFLDHSTVGPLSVVYRELTEMGKFTMVILCDRARRRGVEHVDYVLREGNIRENLVRFAIATQATVMVMGRPTRSPGSNVFKAGEFEAFVTDLEREGNLQVVMITPTEEDHIAPD
jgi:nucleotide-binding universal stress UspA family protein